MSNKTCKLCILTPASDAFSTLPEGAKGDLCWQHQPQEVRDREREKRRLRYQAWLDTGVMQASRDRINKQLKEIM